MNNSTHPQHHGTGHGDVINLLDYYKVIKRHKKMIAGLVMAASVLAVVVSLLLTKMYKAEATIMPISSKGGGGMSALASEFGGLAQIAGLSLPGGTGDSEKIMAILKSRTLAENVINRENLMPILFEDEWDAKNGKWKSSDPKNMPNMELAVKELKTAVTVLDDKKSKTIRITSLFKDPLLASQVVNTYLDELQKFINANAFSTAKRNRIFIEGQLAENKAALLEAGKEINEFYRGGRISAAEAMVDVPVNHDPLTNSPEPQTAVAGVLNDTSTTSHDKSELDSILSQKAEIEKKIADAKVVEDVPQQVYLTYLMLRRELLAKVNVLLTSQYEMAKIEEAKEDLAFQVIDKAVPPVKRAFPKRGQICIMSFMAALFGAIFLAFFREYIEKMKKMHQSQAEA